MGLDLALSGLVLIVAVRGWLRGFVVQAIRLGALVGAAYAAVPARDYARPYAAQYLPTVRPDLADRMLWWVMAAACFFLFSGAASLIVAVSRRNSFGVEESNRSDQFAGFGLGVVKGLLLASFAVAGMQKYGETTLSRIDWVQDQTKESMAWAWGQQYQPAQRIWTSQPVQHFVTHVQRNGINAPANVPPSGEVEKPVQTASRTPKLVLPGFEGGSPLEIDPTGLSSDLVQEVERLQKALSKLEDQP